MRNIIQLTFIIFQKKVQTDNCVTQATVKEALDILRGAVMYCRVMVFNVTFNNISAISWWSVLLVEETRVPGGNPDLSQVTDKL
jgi:hypothetical protein